MITTNTMPTNARAPGLNIVVLAAGFSSRLGQPKALARIHGVSLLRRTVRLIAALRAARIIVVVPPAAARYREQARLRGAAPGAVTLAPNPHRGQGLSSSVRCGLAHAWYCSAVLLLPVDLPHLTLNDLGRLVRRWRAAPGRVHAARMGTHGGAPLILPKRLFPRAVRVVGDSGLRGLLAELPVAAREWVDLPSARIDVDTAADLAAARRRWRSDSRASSPGELAKRP
jgi:molybdenum cofactor cytidylyltransferase